MTSADATGPRSDAWIDRPRRRWGAALKALRRLIADREDTAQVFEIMQALNGASSARNYDRLLRTLEGGRIAYERAELTAKLMDAGWLDGFAAGTVGAAYRDFVRSERLSAEGLAAVSRQGATRIEEMHPYAWFRRRMRDSHDIWHVLTGYHRDALGEACLVAFSFAQNGGLGWALIALTVAVRARLRGDTDRPRAIWQAYRHGRAASWLPKEDCEALMGEPLDAARRRLTIAPPTLYDAIPAGERNPSA